MTRFALGMVAVSLLPGLVLWAAPEQPREEASADQIVGKTASLKGEEYINARDELVKIAADDGFRKKLEEIAKDEEKTFPERLVAEICLLRVTNPVVAEGMRGRMREHVRGTFDVLFAHRPHLPFADYLVRMNVLDLLQWWEEQKDRPDAVPHPLAQAATRDELLLLGELLLYGTDSSIRKDVGQLWPEEGVDSGRNKAKNELIPLEAKVRATWYIVFSDDPEGVSILAHWEPTGLHAGLLVNWRWKCLSAIARFEKKPAESRKQAIAALGRPGAGEYAIGELILLSRDKDPEIRQAAQEALETVKKK